MKIGGNFSEPGSLVPVTRTWRVEKPSPSNNLRDEARRSPARALVPSKAATPSTQRCGTRIIDAEQQLLQPTFVAQVLGQMLGATADNFAATRAYGKIVSGCSYSRFTKVV
jgi:hypothetical protein